MKEFTIHTLPYLAIEDYIFLVFIMLSIILLLWSLNDEGIWPFTIILIIILGTVYYFKHIPYGVYQAKVIRVNDKTIGKNVKNYKKFEIDIDKEYIKKSNSSSLPLCPTKSNIYADIYCNDYFDVLVTKMGTIKIQRIKKSEHTTQYTYSTTKLLKVYY